MLTFSKGPSVSLMSGITEGGGLFNMSWKCSAHLALCSDSVEMVLPSLFLTAFVSLLLFPNIFLVISYNLFMFRCPAAFSASVASLFSCQYIDVRSLFLACSLHRLIPSLRNFLCVIRDQVYFDTQSFRLLALLPKISSHDSPHVFLSPSQ